MIKKNSLVLYKNKAALVKDEGEKITISVAGEKSGKIVLEEVKVREKDVELLHPGPIMSLKELETLPEGDIESSLELLDGTSVSLEELAELVYGEYTPQSAWAAFLLIKDGLYFSGTVRSIKPKEKQQIEDELRKRNEKEQEQTERADFLERLKAKKLNLPDDSRFLQDVEALAYGKTDKSRTLKDIGKPETPEEAHRLLLETNYWTPFKNPHPSRFGLTLTGAKTPIEPPPSDEERIDLTHLRAYAIDNAWSADPDDAISLENNALWVHVADPAASIFAGSPADTEARGRGATLYIPEGAARMINDSALPLFALGLDEKSPALSFKIELDDNGDIANVEICRSLVKVTRFTYEDVDKALRNESENVSKEDRNDFVKLAEIAERNIVRRENLGAISFSMPELHITVKDETISIDSVPSYKASVIVRECMLLAGEGAASWALQKRLPFPYISQEVGDLPASILPGLPGAYQMRRCMGKRQLTAKPSLHAGMGIDGYTQVTSPLRRYTDLLAHQQIRAFLRNETPLSEDEILLRLIAGEAAASAVVHAERASKMHWLAVYLSDKKGSIWDAIVLEKKGPRVQISIPALGLETQTAFKGEANPGDEIKVAVSKCKIPEAEIIVIQAE